MAASVVDDLKTRLSEAEHRAELAEVQVGAGNEVGDESIAHLSPAKFAQINPFGVYNFDTTDVPRQHPLKEVPPS